MNYEFNTEVVTPLFLGGSDARLHPEIRPPSIRGALRFWLRCLVAGIASTEGPLSETLQIESRVFGDTNQAGSVAVTIRGEQRPRIATFTKDHAIRTSDGDYLPTGKDYLFWSNAKSGRPGSPRHQEAREFIMPGERFAFSVRCRDPRHASDLHHAVAATWLMTNLGAMGGRANRGAGSVSVVNSSKPVNGLPFGPSKSLEELVSHLSAGIRACRSIVSPSASARQFTAPPDFDALSPSSASIWVVRGNSRWNTSLDALNGLGEAMRDFRSHRNILGKADHDAVLYWLEGGSPPHIQRAVFGLPIPFRYSDGGPSDVIQHEASDRRASPVRLRVTKLANGEFVGVIVLFKSRFLSAGTQLQLQTRKWKAPAPEHYAVIERFIGTFPVRQMVQL